MKVILKEKIENLGLLGDEVNVKAGYARNFLLPQGKVVRATPENVEIFRVQKAELKKAEQARSYAAKEKASLIHEKEVVIVSKAGESGKLFGSLGAKEVVGAIVEKLGIEIEKSAVRMPEGLIRAIGKYEFTVHLYSDVDATIFVAVEAE